MQRHTFNRYVDLSDVLDHVTVGPRDLKASALGNRFVRYTTCCHCCDTYYILYIIDALRLREGLAAFAPSPSPLHISLCIPRASNCIFFDITNTRTSRHRLPRILVEARDILMSHPFRRRLCWSHPRSYGP